jgi:hypothetical protein
VQHSATILKFDRIDRIEAAGSVLTGSGVEPFWTGYRKTGRSRLTQPTAGLEWFYYNVSRESGLLFEYFLDEFEIRLAVLWRRQESL